MEIKRIGSKTKWENLVSYSRAVECGPYLEFSGTTAVDDFGQIVGIGDAYLQTKFIIGKIKKILHSRGLRLENVIRTRMFVTDIKDWEKVGKAHGENFKGINPCSTLLEISSLVDKDLLVEIEMTAINQKEIVNSFSTI